MSGWGFGWFGGGGQKKRDMPKNAILQLRSTKEMLNKREKHLQNQMDDQDAIARKYINTNKARTSAPICLDTVSLQMSRLRHNRLNQKPAPFTRALKWIYS